MPVPNVQWITPEDGQRNCPKHVEFRTRINLEISASVGFYCKEICYGARSYERKILRTYSNVPNTITVRTHKDSFLNVPIAENPLVTNTGQNDNGRPECSRYLSRVTTTEMSPLFLSLNEWQ